MRTWKRCLHDRVGIGLPVLGAVLCLEIAAAQEAQQVAKLALQSTVLIVVEDSQGQPLGMGSGFFVSDEQVATNAHVVEGAASGYVRVVGDEKMYKIEGISGKDERRDLVVLKVAEKGFKKLMLGDSEKVEVGQSVYVVGNPQGLEGTFSQGIVSGIRRAGSDKVLQLTAPISPGSSGGPVLNSRGEVIGVAVATIKDGQNLNFAIPSSYLSELLKMNGKVETLSSVSRGNVQESLVESLGSPDSEGVVVTNIQRASVGMSFSLVNRLSYPVTNISGTVILYDANKQPVDFENFEFPKQGYAGGRNVTSGLYPVYPTIPPSLAKEIRLLFGHSSRGGTVEVRILSYERASS